MNLNQHSNAGASFNEVSKESKFSVSTCPVDLILILSEDKKKIFLLPDNSKNMHKPILKSFSRKHESGESEEEALQKTLEKHFDGRVASNLVQRIGEVKLGEKKKFNFYFLPEKFAGTMPENTLKLPLSGIKSGSRFIGKIKDKNDQYKDHHCQPTRVLIDAVKFLRAFQEESASQKVDK